ncbi:MAG: HD domain-containing protein [bacterium]|nr:HD domain-containing protein [bacterium]MBU1428052.1 HD domain-containing protein [bacterium]MBU2439989.1 HD domain-containing protein [bacterium]
MRIDYDDMLEYTREKIRSNSRKSSHTFRDRFIHTLRVLKWAERINEIEGGDQEVVRIASIFHDVGWDDEIHHAIVSKSIANDYLLKIDIEEEKKEKILEAIENHSFRENDKPLSLESYIVMDADYLDEVGAISILWDAMAEANKVNTSYKSAYRRIKKYAKSLIEQKNRLKTKTGRKFYEERLGVINTFLNELKFELEEY